MTKELATMEGSIREMAAQVQPYKDAKEAAKKAHQVLCSILCIVLDSVLYTKTR